MQGSDNTDLLESHLKEKFTELFGELMGYSKIGTSPHSNC